MRAGKFGGAGRPLNDLPRGVVQPKVLPFEMQRTGLASQAACGSPRRLVAIELPDEVERTVPSAFMRKPGASD